MDGGKNPGTAALPSLLAADRQTGRQMDGWRIIPGTAAVSSLFAADKQTGRQMDGWRGLGVAAALEQQQHVTCCSWVWFDSSKRLISKLAQSMEMVSSSLSPVMRSNCE